MSAREVKVGFIGISGRGRGMLKELLSVEGVNVVAVCDKYEDRKDNGIKIVEEKTGKTPLGFLDYKELLKIEEIEAIVCCTTWITHARIAVDSMRAGKDVAFEVGGAASVEECWQMVRTSEETGKRCMLLENCCYDRNEMALFNMVKQGIFGEIIHLEGGYRHDLRSEIVHGKENRHGRLKNFIARNGEVYPTHQLGPICKLININRGNRLLTLTSMASKARGLHEYIKTHEDESYYLSNQVFNLGDVVTTMIKCANGETITLTHDCSLPRPYSREYVVQGTKGIYKEGYVDTIYLDGAKDGEKWGEFNDVREQYEHPLWKEYFVKGVHEGGHGGMDFLVLSSFIDSIQRDIAPPIDVYDAATWMVITCLSEQSVAMGSMPVPIPDFTNGAWIEREPDSRGRYCLTDICDEFYDLSAVKEEAEEEK